ncbi:MAG: hypothetical protein QOG89_2924 [Thermomicrobiales bacterium]|nr:hypothetical protein [Thermomicrobiales bacterium]
MNHVLDSSRSFLTRRAALAHLAGGGLGVAIAVRGTAAQEATPTPLPAALEEWIAGWQTLDPGRIAAIYAEDGVHEVVATGEVIEGRSAIRDNIAALMTAIPDATLGVNRAFATGDAGAIDWTFTGHYTSQLPGFPPPAGQALTFRAVILFELASGQIVRSTEFYDLYGLLVQIGAVPMPGGEATPVATTGCSLSEAVCRTNTAGRSRGRRRGTRRRSSPDPSPRPR